MNICTCQHYARNNSKHNIKVQVVNEAIRNRKVNDTLHLNHEKIKANVGTTIKIVQTNTISKTNQ